MTAENRWAGPLLGAVEHLFVPVATVGVLASVASFGLDRLLGPGSLSDRYTQVVVCLLAGVVLTVRYARSHGDHGRAPGWFAGLGSAAILAVIAIPVVSGSQANTFGALFGAAFGMASLWWMAGRLAGRLALTARRRPDPIVITPADRGPRMSDPSPHLGTDLPDAAPAPTPNLDPLARLQRRHSDSSDSSDPSDPSDPSDASESTVEPSVAPPPPAPSRSPLAQRLARWSRIAASDALGRSEAEDPGRPARDLVAVAVVAALVFTLGDPLAGAGDDDAVLGAWAQVLWFVGSASVLAILASGLAGLKAVARRGGRADAGVLAWRSALGLVLLVPVLVASLALPGLRFQGTASAPAGSDDATVARASSDPGAQQGSGGQGDGGQDSPPVAPSTSLSPLVDLARKVAPLVGGLVLILAIVQLVRRLPRPGPRAAEPEPAAGPLPLPEDDGTPAAAVRRAYARLLRACADRGFPPLPHQTPREFLRALPPRTPPRRRVHRRADAVLRSRRIRRGPRRRSCCARSPERSPLPHGPVGRLSVPHLRRLARCRSALPSLQSPFLTLCPVPFRTGPELCSPRSRPRGGGPHEESSPGARRHRRPRRDRRAGHRHEWPRRHHTGAVHRHLRDPG